MVSKVSFNRKITVLDSEIIIKYNIRLEIKRIF